jgi:TPR repeat protein
MHEKPGIADDGDTEAKHNLGLGFYYDHGVPQNDAEAVKWYPKRPRREVSRPPWG